MSSEKDFPLSADFLAGIDLKADERARVEALQSFLDEGGAAAHTELEQMDNNTVINEEVARLDEQCSHVNKPVFVSGEARVAYYNDFTEKDAEETRRLTDMQLLSRGFTVQPVDHDGRRRLVVGHLFEMPDTRRTSNVNGLVEQISVYHAFAPYGSIDITALRTDEERRAYLEAMIPDVMSDTDELLYDAPTPLAALMRLRKLSINRKDIPADVLRELVTYVSDFIGVKDIPLSTFELSGTRSVDINDQMSITTPYDRHHYTGGGALVAGKIDYLYLSPYVSYVDGEMYQSTDSRWAVGIAAESAADPHGHLAGQTLDVLAADIRDAAPIIPTSPRATH